MKGSMCAETEVHRGTLCSERANITLVVHVDITYLYIPLSYNAVC
jgi:hypothetical protein